RQLRAGPSGCASRRCRCIPTTTSIASSKLSRWSSSGRRNAKPHSSPPSSGGGITTHHMVVSFVRGDKGELVPGQPLRCPNRYAAGRLARRLALTAAGAVAFSRPRDPRTGSFAAASLLEKFGDVSEEFLESASR